MTVDIDIPQTIREWMAWETLVVELLPPTQSAHRADPAEVEQQLAGMTVDRLGRLCYLFVGHQHADTLEQAADLLGAVRERLVRGERPRSLGDAIAGVRP